MKPDAQAFTYLQEYVKDLDIYIQKNQDLMLSDAKMLLQDAVNIMNEINQQLPTAEANLQQIEEKAPEVKKSFTEILTELSNTLEVSFH